MAAIVQGTSPRPAAGFISWGPVIGGAISAAALSSVLLAFGVAVGMSVSSASPTWRDTSAALALLSGLYLLLQALVSFGLGGYVAGRTRQSVAGSADTVEHGDGAHGLLAWALAVLLGVVLAAAVASIAGSGTKTPSANQSTTTSAEPVLSYELDRLFRGPRRPPNADLTNERAEAGRILLKTAGHNGIDPDDRTYLIQQVATLTGASPADAERRVNDVIAKSREAIRKARQTAVILAFSAAAALLLGAVASWWAAVSGGRHRDGEQLPLWMTHGDYLTHRHDAPTRSVSSPQPLPE